MGFSARKRRGPIYEINVTPFVDVVLVLLIIFMVTAPLIYNSIDLTLPKTKKVKNIKLNEKQVILSINHLGEFFLGKRRFLLEELVSGIKAELENNQAEVLFMRVHEEVKYGQLAKIMSYLKKSGISNLALVTEIEKE